jgi:FMN reductase
VNRRKETDSMAKFSIIGVSGSLSRPSRTSALVAAVLDQVQERLDVHTQLFDLADISQGLFAAASFDRLSPPNRTIVEDIENADLLVVGTPVYRGSYSGAFKHLFDLVRHDRLRGKPVILTATGGSQLHGLVTEHQLRPLFGFFNALGLPTAIYATEADFANCLLANGAIRQRISAAVDEALHALKPRVASAFGKSDRPALAATA